MAFDQVSPLPDRRSDLQHASVVATMWNLELARQGGDLRFSPEDFVLDYGPKKRKRQPPAKKGPDWQKMKMTAMIVAGASLQGFGADNGPAKKRK